MLCENCQASNKLLLVTKRGKTLCDNCYDLELELSKAECFIEIMLGKESIEAFDADTLGEIICSWKRHKNSLDLSALEILEIEEIATRLGLL